VDAQIDLLNEQLGSVVHVDLGSLQDVASYVPSLPGWTVVSHVESAALWKQDSPARVPSGYVTTGKPAAVVAVDVSSVYNGGGVGLVPIVLQYTLSSRELINLFGEDTARAILTNPTLRSSRIFEKFSIHKEIAGTYELVNLVPGLISPYNIASGSGVVRLAGGGQLTIGLSFLAADEAGSPRMEGQYLIVPDGTRDGVVRDPAWLLMTNSTASPTPVTPSPRPNPSPSPSQKSGGGCNEGFGVVFAALALSAVLLYARRAR
jgi:hypothetical protein